MENNEKTTLFLVPAELQQFLVFQEHYDFFSTLIDHEVQDVRNGKAVLNFDNNSLRTIVVEKIVYKN